MEHKVFCEGRFKVASGVGKVILTKKIIEVLSSKVVFHIKKQIRNFYDNDLFVRFGFSTGLAHEYKKLEKIRT